MTSGGRYKKYDYSYKEEAPSITGLGERVDALEEEGGGGGTSDYEKLKNLPTLNGEVVKGNKESDDYNLLGKENAISQARIDEICQ